MSNDSQTKVCQKPCPICQKLMFITGTDEKGKKLTSCGHRFAFKKTKSEKIMDRKFVKTAWGMELVK